MRQTLPILVLTLLVAACAGEPEAVWTRVVDGFESGMVQGSPEIVEPASAEWRFDGEGTIEVPEEDGETYGWTAFNDVEGLAVRDGMLVGTTGELPILLGVRSDVPEDDEPLYAIEVRMRVSEGTEVGITLNGAQERDDEWVEARIEGLTDQPRPQLRAELTPGDDFTTYTLREAGANFRIRQVRNVLLEPSDVEGAEFEIESVRVISLKENLASIPSGPGWHGLGEIYRETIVARTPERVVVDLELQERPWLDLAYGTIEDGPLTFEVTVSAGGFETSLLKRTVTTPDRWTVTRLDLTEYAAFHACMTGPDFADEVPTCRCYDLNRDGHIDLLDFSGLQLAF